MKKFLALSMAAAMTLSLAACSGGTSGSTSGSSNGSTGSDGDTIKIGLIANTTGGNAQYGIAVKNGAMLYVDNLNEAGGINGKQVEVIAYDDKGDPTEAANAYNRMADEGVTAVIGAVLTGTTVAVADLAYNDNMPMITASATAPSVTLLEPEDPSQGIRENVFRACFIDTFQGEKMAHYAADRMGAQTAAVIFKTGDDYSEGLKNAFVETCAELGITVTSEQGYAAGDVDFKAQLTTIANENPDVVFCPNYYEDDGMIVTQARQVGVKSTFLGGDGWPGVAGYASAEDLEGAAYCSGCGLGTNTEFETSYEEKYGEPITGMFEPLGYDAALLILDAVASAEGQGLEAGSADYKQAVIDAMKATNGTEGLTGTFSFDEYNNPIKSVSMIKLEGGVEKFSEQY